jgi:type I restriction enzyme S subunit
MKTEQIRLKYIANLSGSPVKEFEGEKEYYSTGAVDGTESAQMVTYENKPSRANVLVKENDILIAKMKNTNKTTLVDKNMEENIYSTGFAVLKANDKVIDEYLFYLLSCDEFEQLKNINSFGTTQQAINEFNLKNLVLTYILNKLEQQKIVDKLNKEIPNIDFTISNTEQDIKDLEKYKKAIITEAVTKGLDKTVPMKDSGIDWIGKIPEDWEYKRLKYLLKQNCINLRVGPFGSSLSGSDIKDEGYWVYNQRCVLDNNFEYNDTYVDEEKFRELYGFRVFPNDTLITTRGTIGKVAIVPQNAPKGILHPCIIKFVLDEKLINNKLIEYIFNESEIITEQIFRQSNSTTIEVIYSYTLKDLVLPVIPEKEQQEIADYLDDKCSKINELIKDKEAQIEKMEKYKKSLIYEYVTGKKRVKGAV